MKKLVMVLLLAGCGEPERPSGLPSSRESPLSPDEERLTFRVPEGFQVSLVAAEPDVVDPVAMAFDERGRLYVVEMPGFPNGDTAEGKPSIPGRIKLLENPDGAHRYRKCTVFVTGLAFPTSVMPYRKGILAACAPDLTYFEDADGDGHPSSRRVLYTGFGLKNIEAQVNGLQWGIDNWVHGLGSFNGGDIRCPENPQNPAISLQGRGFRFRPDAPGRFEPTLARGQFGLACDEWDRWFTCTNNEHVKHVVWDDRYLSREPCLAAPPAVINVSDHGSAAKLYRVSPYEAWRVERTTRRANSDQRSRFPAAELVPGGYVTSGCGLVAYGGGLFPPEFTGNILVCDPANNLVHRDILDAVGATFVARRAPTDLEREFLASTDPWFRPVNLTVGPDGALYVADFYREVIEGASFIPEDIKAKLKLNFQSGGRGRIWRVAPKDLAPAAPALDRATVEELVAALGHANGWRRLTAQRLLVQDGRKEAVPALRALAAKSPDPRARLHALWSLEGLGALEESTLLPALKDPEPGVREHAVRLAERRLRSPKPLRSLVDDPSPRVRFQLALTLGEFTDTTPILARLAARDGGDPYARAAILSSGGRHLLDLFTQAVGAKAPVPFLTDLFHLVGARLEGGEIAGLLLLAEKLPPDEALAASLAGLARGIRQRRKTRLEIPAAREILERLLSAPSASIRKAASEVAAQIRTMSEEELRAELEKARIRAADESRAVNERAEAILFLGSGEFKSVASILAEFLSPRHPETLQRAAAESLGALTDPGVAGVILEQWRRVTPGIRERLIDLLFDRKDRLRPLLEAIERGEISAGELDPRRRGQLVSFPDKEISARAGAIFKETRMDPKLFEAAKGALGLPGDAMRGRAFFRKLCMSCHQARGEGAVVGPALASVRDNPPEEILKNILYPSLVIAPQYAQYLVETRDGQILNGLIVESSEAAVTLRRPNVEDAKLLRRDIKNLVVGRVSLMPEDLLKGLSLQDIADLLKFVREID